MFLWKKSLPRKFHKSQQYYCILQKIYYKKKRKKEKVSLKVLLVKMYYDLPISFPEKLFMIDISVATIESDTNNK